jgi:hypothetical protein
MRGIAILTTLAMSAGTAVYAAPARVADRDDVRVQVRDGDWTRDRYDNYRRSHWSHDFRGRWQTLARAYSAQTQRQFIPVRGAMLSKLRVEGVRGAPVIEKIGIEFGDGTSQAVDVNMRLSGGAGEVIDLNGGVRKVNRIIVYTDGRTRGSYSIYGA